MNDFIQTEDVSRELDERISGAEQAIKTIRDLDRTQAQRLSGLANERTDAFVVLSKHYLPGLDHQNVANAWTEIKQEIRDVMLRKDRQRREVQEGIRRTEDQCTVIREKLATAKKTQDEAAKVLLCKAGNVRKILRDDPQVAACNQQIAQLDKDIEHCLTHLERAESESNLKLPDYEESHLFSYLRDRKFGTPEYDESGLERRWDRWVAKMINYDKAKRSYDFLAETPRQLKTLIDEKQSRYRALLDQLKLARDRAIKQHGVKQQSDLWKSLTRDIEELEEQLAEERWHIAELETKLSDLSKIDGPYYDAALKIYQRFLESLEPEILKVYAECTESPIDDEICAKIRDLESSTDNEKRAAKDRFIQVLKYEKAIAAFTDLAARLRDHLRQAPGEILISTTFDLQHWIDDVQQQRITSDRAWRALREAMVIPAELIDPSSRTQASQEILKSMTPMDAVLMAAAEFSRKAPAGDKVDLSGVSLVPPGTSYDSRKPAGYRTLAICRSKAEAKFVIRMLATESIPAFRYTHPINYAEPLQTPPVDVVVADRDFQRARALFEEERERQEGKWNCERCQTDVEQGFRLCFRCGRKRHH